MVFLRLYFNILMYYIKYFSKSFKVFWGLGQLKPSGTLFSKLASQIVCANNGPHPSERGLPGGARISEFYGLIPEIISGQVWAGSGQDADFEALNT